MKPVLQTNTPCLPNVGLMLGQRRKRWPNIKPTLVHRLVCKGYSNQEVLTLFRFSVGPMFRTVAQHKTNTGGPPHVFCKPLFSSHTLYIVDCYHQVKLAAPEFLRCKQSDTVTNQFLDAGKFMGCLCHFDESGGSLLIKVLGHNYL